ncbi:MAG: PEGA domain-containing protein [Myxococcota bacterium]
MRIKNPSRLGTILCLGTALLLGSVAHAQEDGEPPLDEEPLEEPETDKPATKLPEKPSLAPEKAPKAKEAPPEDLAPTPEPAPRATVEKTKVYLLPYQPIARQAAPELCAQVTNVISSELGNADTLALVQGAGEGGGEQAESGGEVNSEEQDKAKAALDRGLKLSNTGANQVKKLKFDPAIKSLTEALKSFDAAAPAVTDVAPIRDAHLNLAVAYWRRGLEEESMAQMAQAARLDPEFKPDPKEYWPLFLRVYDQQWRKTLRVPRGKLRVEATVPGAEVFFDGKSVGAVPLMLTNVVPGAHYLRVVKDGAGTFGATVDVPSEKTQDVTADLGGGNAGEASLGPVAQAVSNNLVDDAALSAARQLGKKHGAEFVLFGGVRKGENTINVHTFIVRTHDGAAGRLVDLELDADLLSAAVEAFKLVEEVGSRVKDFGDTVPPGAVPIVRGVEAASGPGITEVDVGPAIPEAAGKAVARKGDDEGSRVAIGGEEEKAAKAARLGDDKRKGPTTTKDDYKASTPIWRNPVVLGVAGAGAAAVVAVVLVAVTAGLVGGGVSGYIFLTPAQTAEVKATW